MYMGTNYNVQLYMARSPCFYLPLLIPLCLPLCSPFGPLLLTWNPPSCDRIRPPRSQVACKLTPLDPTLSPTLPLPNSQSPKHPAPHKDDLRNNPASSVGNTNPLKNFAVHFKGLWEGIMVLKSLLSKLIGHRNT
jgi:hypothetical protein